MAVAVAAALALAPGCGAADRRTPGRLPERVLPDRMADLAVRAERSGEAAFKQAGPNSLVHEGRVYTLRRNGEVQAALQISVLKPRFDTDEIEVRRGIRTYIENGRYRWFKIRDRQWVGVQDLAELRLYLWFPPRGDLFQLLQVRPEVANPKALVTAIIDYQEGQ